MYSPGRSTLGRVIEHLKKHGLLYDAIEVLEETKRLYDEHVKSDYYKYRIIQTAEEVGSGLWVGGESSVNSRTKLGDNVHFWGMAVHGDGRLTIGDNFHSGSGCVIITADHNYDEGADAIPYDGTYTRDEVNIGDNVWFGRNVTVLPGVTIDEGAVIQVGSVVTEDIPEGAIAGGHPAEVFAYRDMDHYRALKSEGKFH